MTAKQLHNFALFRLRESIYGTEDVRLHPHVLATYFQVPKRPHPKPARRTTAEETLRTYSRTLL